MGYRTKQEKLLHMALCEKNADYNPTLASTDHEFGLNAYNGQKFNLIFPEIFVRKSQNLHTYVKKYDYNFVGKYAKCREWVKGYVDNPKVHINFTEHGRQIAKDDYDDVYFYNILSESKFTLCPAGCTPNRKTGALIWSYRFTEAIMCKSIPIILREDYIADKMEGFKFFFEDEKHYFTKEIVDRNFELFLMKHTFIKINPFK